jgi:hypothetical protein
METNNSTTPVTRMELDEISVAYLSSIRKWAYFFAILGFVGIAILLIVGLFAKAIFGALNPQMEAAAFVIGAVYIVLALIYIFPVIYMYRFSTIAKAAIGENDSTLLQQSLQYLKKHFQYVGIVTIAVLGLYFVIILGFILGKIFLG